MMMHMFEYQECSSGPQRVRKATLDALKEMVLDGQHAQALQEYGKFHAREPPFGVGSNLFSMMVVDSLSSYGWWKACANLGPVQNVAIAVGAILTTASAIEHNCNEFRQIYTRNRNRLKPECLRKLVFIYHNLRIVARMKVTKEDRPQEAAASAVAVSAFCCSRDRYRSHYVIHHPFHIDFHLFHVDFHYVHYSSASHCDSARFGDLLNPDFLEPCDKVFFACTGPGRVRRVPI